MIVTDEKPWIEQTIAHLTRAESLLLEFVPADGLEGKEWKEILSKLRDLKADIRGLRYWPPRDEKNGHPSQRESPS